MTIKLRTAHRFIWFVLAVSLPVGIIMGLQLRTPMPVEKPSDLPTANTRPDSTVTPIHP